MSGSHRDISLILQRWRAFLLGREHTLGLRFQKNLAERTQPPPTIPGGPAHKLFNNNYLKRDIRHSVHPPIEVVAKKLIEAKQIAKPGRKPDIKQVIKKVNASDRTPGPLYRFD